MEFEIVEIKEQTNSIINELTELWEKSVRATHLFLSVDEVQKIKQYVPQALKEIAVLTAAVDNNGNFLGFMGTVNGKLEMLFLAPEQIGKGIGKILLLYAIENYGVTELTVNEQNPHAEGFYKHLGFEVYKRTLNDEQGNPYPILYMRLNNNYRGKNMQKLTDKFEFRNIRADEVEQVIKIEQICFSSNKACTEDYMRKIIMNASELFFTAVDKHSGKIAGFINGLATDECTFRDDFFTDADLHRADGKNIMILGLAVLPEYRGLGLARELMNTLKSEQKEREAIVLTCLDSKVEMYKKMNFQDNGISESCWGGEKWHEMSCRI